MRKTDWFRHFYLVITVYVVVASGSIFVRQLVGSDTVSFQSVYSVALLLLALFMAVSSPTSKKVVQVKFLQEVGFASCLVTLWFLIRWPVSGAYSVWFDEVSQFLVPGDIGIFSAQQQQPPVDYFLSAWARWWGGDTESAVLFHAHLFGATAFGLFGYWLRLIRLHWAYVPVFLLLIAGQATMLRFNFEARPISLALVWAMFIFIFTWQQIVHQIKRERLIFSASLLLLLSIGFQPLFFLFFVWAGILIGPLRKSSFSDKKRWTVTLMGPVVLFAPLLVLVYQFLGPQGHFFPETFVETWSQSISNFPWNNLARFSGLWRHAEWIFALPFVFHLVLRLKKTNSSEEDVPSWSWAAYIFVFLFPLAFVFVWQVINYPLYLSYVALWVLGAGVYASLCLSCLLGRLGSDKPKGIRFLQPAVAGVLLIFTILVFLPFQRQMLHRQKSWYPNWKKVMLTAPENGPKESAFVVLPLLAAGEDYYHGLVGKLFQTQYRQVTSTWWLEDYKKWDDVFPAKKDLYLVVPIPQERRASFSTLETSINQQVDGVFRPDDKTLVLLVNDDSNQRARGLVLIQKLISEGSLAPYLEHLNKFVERSETL